MILARREDGTERSAAEGGPARTPVLTDLRVPRTPGRIGAAANMLRSGAPLRWRIDRGPPGPAHRRSSIPSRSRNPPYSTASPRPLKQGAGALLGIVRRRAGRSNRTRAGPARYLPQWAEPSTPRIPMMHYWQSTTTGGRPPASPPFQKSLGECRTLRETPLARLSSRCRSRFRDGS